MLATSTSVKYSGKIESTLKTLKLRGPIHNDSPDSLLGYISLPHFDALGSNPTSDVENLLYLLPAVLGGFKCR